MRQESLDFLKRIVDAPSPSGYEQPAARVYRSYTEPFADCVSTDVHGNVTAVLNPGATMRIMLAGHMDELGFIVHHIDDQGQLHFRTIGGHDSAVAIGQRLWIYGKQRIAGVIGRTAIHLQDEAERKKKPEIKDMWIDIGATIARRGRGGRQPRRRRDLPMRVSAAAGRSRDGTRLRQQDGHFRRRRGAASAQGRRAASTRTSASMRWRPSRRRLACAARRTASYGIAAQTGLAVDVNHATDYPGVSKVLHGQLEVGKGPSVSRGPNTNHVTFDLITAAAREAEIPYQVSVSAGGTGTDANAMQLNRAGMATGLLGVPLRYMHTPVELLSLKDVEDCARLMAGYCRRVKPDTDFTPR